MSPTMSGISVARMNNVGMQTLPHDYQVLKCEVLFLCSIKISMSTIKYAYITVLQPKNVERHFFQGSKDMYD